MTHDGSRAVRWLVIFALSVATAGMFLISMRANYLYGRSIGQSPETQEALAWANVGADVWKGFGLIVVTVLWRARFRRAAITTGLTWFVCLSFSVSSAIGIYVQERTSLTGSREAKHVSYEDAQHELADVERKLEGLARHRSVGEVEAAIAGVLARPIVIADRRSCRPVLGMAHARMDHRACRRVCPSLVLCLDDRDGFRVRSVRDCRVRRRDAATIDTRHGSSCRGQSRYVAHGRGRPHRYDAHRN